jgi:hypothetical protein
MPVESPRMNSRDRFGYYLKHGAHLFAVEEDNLTVWWTTEPKGALILGWRYAHILQRAIRGTRVVRARKVKTSASRGQLWDIRLLARDLRWLLETGKSGDHR